MSNVDQAIIQRFRHSHHVVAMMFASGMELQEIIRRTGFPQRRLMLLYADPTYQELIEHYKKQTVEAFQSAGNEFMELMTGNALIAQRQIRDKLEKAEDLDELLPTKDLLAISSDAADRIGYPKQKESRDTLHVSFSDALDRAIERSGQAKVIDHVETDASSSRTELRLSRPSELPQAAPAPVRSAPSFVRVLKRV